jgi:hypothetical protein
MALPDKDFRISKLLFNIKGREIKFLTILELGPSLITV